MSLKKTQRPFWWPINPYRRFKQKTEWKAWDRADDLIYRKHSRFMIVGEAGMRMEMHWEERLRKESVRPSVFMQVKKLYKYKNKMPAPGLSIRI